MQQYGNQWLAEKKKKLCRRQRSRNWMNYRKNSWAVMQRWQKWSKNQANESIKHISQIGDVCDGTPLFLFQVLPAPILTHRLSLQFTLLAQLWDRIRWAVLHHAWFGVELLSRRVHWRVTVRLTVFYFRKLRLLWLILFCFLLSLYILFQEIV